MSKTSAAASTGTPVIVSGKLSRSGRRILLDRQDRRVCLMMSPVETEHREYHQRCGGHQLRKKPLCTAVVCCCLERTCVVDKKACAEMLW